MPLTAPAPASHAAHSPTRPRGRTPAAIAASGTLQLDERVSAQARALGSELAQSRQLLRTLAEALELGAGEAPAEHALPRTPPSVRPCVTPPAWPPV